MAQHGPNWPTGSIGRRSTLASYMMLCAGSVRFRFLERKNAFAVNLRLPSSCGCLAKVRAVVEWPNI